MKRHSAVLVFLLIGSSLFAQESYKPQIHVPKTPEVAAMEKFIDNPVNLNTGLHDVTIPIYNLSIKDISIPIALKYHSSGMKVDDLASNVGLGWSLDVEGAVSSSVNGIPDTDGDWPNAFYSKIKNGGFATYYQGINVTQFVYESTEDPLDLYSGTDLQFLKGALKSTRDSEPDIFFFSFPGGSGKFFIDENGNFQTIPHQKIKIERVLSSGQLTGYKITDVNGTVYEFLSEEESYTTSSSSCDGMNTSPVQLPHSSFKLTKITSTNNSVVNFYYTSYNYSVDNQKQFSRTGPGNSEDIACKTTYIPNETLPCTTISATNFTGAKRLDSLTTNYGDKVVFNYSGDNRLDLPESKRMIGVSVYKKHLLNAYQLIKSFEFDNGTYFQAGSSSPTTKLNYRLKLSSVREVGKPSYQFQYDETEIPHRLSFAQDHWGYFNGASNANLLPVEPHNGFETGANRDANFVKSTSCILTKMIYPTGGFLDFEYEQNSYYSTGGELYYTPASASLASQADATVTTQFTIPLNSALHKFIWTNDDDGINTANDYCKIRITGPNGFNRFFYNSSPANGEINFLSPGTYTIQIETVGSSMDGTITASWLSQQTMTAGNRLTGGVRIKKSRNCAGSACIENYYSYVKNSSTSSSGQIFYSPLYTYLANKRYLQCNGCSGSVFTAHFCNVYIQSSSSLTPLANTQGSHVVYDEVAVSNTSAGTQGKTVYKFLVDKSANSTFGYYPFAPVITYDWLTGLTKEVTVYAYSGGQFVKAKRTTNKYIYSAVSNIPDTLSNQTSVFGAKVGLQDYPSGCFNECFPEYSLPEIGFAVARYELRSSWHYLNETTEIAYANNGQDSLLNTTQFFYDNPDHIQLTRTKNYKSDGTLQTGTSKYPLDYAYGTNVVIDRLHTKHMVTPVIEQKLEQGSPPSSLINSKLFLYKNVDATSVLDKVKTFAPSSSIASNTFTFYNGTTLDSRYEDEVIIESYDANKNPIQYTDRSGITGAYLWDYNSSLPIATVSNAQYSHIAYTSFESSGGGNWTITGATRITGSSLTGDRHYSLSAGAISKSGLDSNKKYWISFWVKPGSSISVICSQIVSSTTSAELSGWELKQYLISGSTSVQIQGTGYIDELRLHPENASMMTYAHKPGVGLIASGNANNILSFYEYDSVGRLKNIKDHKGNITKNFQYHYKND